jgi:hypothetical protein
MQMPAQQFNMLWKAIDVLEAQEHINLCRALQYPMLKRQARVERDKKLYNAAYPRDIYKKEAKSASFLVEKLGGNRG